MTLKMLLRWKSQDLTKDLNARLKYVLQKGVLTGGLVTPVSSQLKVDVSAFTALSDSGALVVSDAVETVDVTDAAVNYIVCRAEYVDNDSAILDVQGLTAAAYGAVSDPENLVIFATVDLTSGGPHTQVASSEISYALRDMLDRDGRHSFREPVANPGALPSGTGHMNRDGDVRLTLSTNALYQWDSGTQTWDLVVAASATPVATDSVQGTVKLAYVAGNTSDPIVAPRDGDGRISNTASGNNGYGLSGTAHGTGYGVVGNGGASGTPGTGGGAYFRGGGANSDGVQARGRGTGAAVHAHSEDTGPAVRSVGDIEFTSSTFAVKYTPARTWTRLVLPHDFVASAHHQRVDDFFSPGKLYGGFIPFTSFALIANTSVSSSTTYSALVRLPATTVVTSAEIFLGNGDVAPHDVHVALNWVEYDAASPGWAATALALHPDTVFSTAMKTLSVSAGSTAWTSIPLDATTTVPDGAVLMFTIIFTGAPLSDSIGQLYSTGARIQFTQTSVHDTY